MLGTGVVGLGLVNAPLWSQDMFEGVVLLAALAATGYQRRSLWRGRTNALMALLRRQAAA
jgi:ribose/xylose/arabinose/galactoside ABC-type transport system permease subunit